MHFLYLLLAVLVVGVLIWWQVKYYRANPQAYSKQNFAKTARTLGILAIALIAFVTVLVWLTRTG